MKAPVVLLFVGAVLLAVGTFTKSWMTAGEGDVQLHAGLREAEVCGSSDHCETLSYTTMMKESSRARDVVMAISGTAAFILGIVAMIFAAITGGLLLGNAPKSALGVLTIIAVALAAAASFAFAGSIDKSAGMNFGFSLFAFEAGFITALLGAIGSFSHARGAAGAPRGAAPAAQTMGPPCTRCGTPATFVAQYQRYFCHSCNSYL